MKLQLASIFVLSCPCLYGQAGLTITADDTSLPAGLVGHAYAARTLNAVGGSPPYRWSVEGTALPEGMNLSPGGVVSGTPESGFCCFVRVVVTDSANRTAQAAIAFSIQASEYPYEPGGTFLQAYTNRGTGPYACQVVQGELPPGVSLTPGCMAGGVLHRTGEYSFTVRIVSSDNVTFDAATTLRVPLRIAPEELPEGTMGVAFGQTLRPQFGTGPYRFEVEDGGLPEGVQLSASGELSGTPRLFGASVFRARVTDGSGNQQSQTFRFYTKFPVPAVRYQLSNTGVGQTASVGLTLVTPYPVELTGILGIEFLAETGLPTDDPTILLNNNDRRASFVIPAGSTTAQFSGGPLTFDTGSVAGDIFVVSSLRAEGYDVTPFATPYWLIRLPRAAPVIRSVTAARNATGLSVTIQGFSNSRELTQAVIRLTPAAGASLQQTEFTVQLTQPAAAFFASASSLAFGSQFNLTLPVSVSAGGAAVSSVSVTLSNAIGTSASVSAEAR